jgi:hypothetical protein
MRFELALTDKRRREVLYSEGSARRLAPATALRLNARRPHEFPSKRSAWGGLRVRGTREAAKRFFQKCEFITSTINIHYCPVCSASRTRATVGCHWLSERETLIHWCKTHSRAEPVCSPGATRSLRSVIQHRPACSATRLHSARERVPLRRVRARLQWLHHAPVRITADRHTGSAREAVQLVWIRLSPSLRKVAPRPLRCASQVGRALLRSARPTFSRKSVGKTLLAGDIQMLGGSRSPEAAGNRIR